jgi:hypothetical protein
MAAMTRSPVLAVLASGSGASENPSDFALGLSIGKRILLPSGLSDDLPVLHHEDYLPEGANVV